MWFTEVESKIVEHGRRKELKELNDIRKMLLKKHDEASYMVSRFMQEYGDRLDTDPKATSLFQKFSSEYTAIERLLTIIGSYERRV